MPPCQPRNDRGWRSAVDLNLWKQEIAAQERRLASFRLTEAIDGERSSLMARRLSRILFAGNVQGCRSELRAHPCLNLRGIIEAGSAMGEDPTAASCALSANASFVCRCEQPRRTRSVCWSRRRIDRAEGSASSPLQPILPALARYCAPTPASTVCHPQRRRFNRRRRSSSGPASGSQSLRARPGGTRYFRKLQAPGVAGENALSAGTLASTR